MRHGSRGGIVGRAVAKVPGNVGDRARRSISESDLQWGHTAGWAASEEGCRHDGPETGYRVCAIAASAGGETDHIAEAGLGGGIEAHDNVRRTKARQAERGSREDRESR